MAFTSQPLESSAHPNWGFVGFSQGGFAARYENDEYYSERGTISDSVIRTVAGVDTVWILLIFDVATGQRVMHKRTSAV